MTRPRTQPDDASDWANHELRIRTLETVISRGILATQVQYGNNANYVNIPAAGVALKRDASNDFALVFTPPVDCYWDVEAYFARFMKTDANWHHIYIDLRLSPADDDSVSQSFDHIVEANSAGAQYYRLNPHWRWRLTGGVQYTCKAHLGAIEGGTWQYHQGASYSCMRGTAFVPVVGMP